MTCIPLTATSGFYNIFGQFVPSIDRNRNVAFKGWIHKAPGMNENWNVHALDFRGNPFFEIWCKMSCASAELGCGVWVTAHRATVPRFEVYIGLQHNYDGLLADREIPTVESTHNRTWQRCCSCDVTSMSLATWGHVPATVAHHLRATTRLEAPVGHHIDQSYDSRDVLWFYPT